MIVIISKYWALIFCYSNKNMKNGFIQQTADDYAMSYEEVEKIYKFFPNNFYEKLEEFIKGRAGQLKC